MTNDGFPVPLADRHFEDYTPGLTGQYGAILVTEESIVKFAQAFDPQQMHANRWRPRTGPLAG